MAVEKKPMHHPKSGGVGTYVTERQFERVWAPKGWKPGAPTDTSAAPAAVTPTAPAGTAAGKPKEA